MFDVWCSLLVVGCWLLVVGLVFGVRCLVFVVWVVCCLVFGFGRVLFVVRCSLPFGC